MQGADCAHDKPEDEEKPIGFVRDDLREREANDRVESEDLARHVVAHDGAHHDGDDEGRVERLVDLLKREHHAREGRMKGRRHARTGTAGDEKALLSPSTAEHARDALAGHAAKLDRWSLPAKGKTAKRAERSFYELCGYHAVPGSLHGTHDLCVYLRYSRAGRRWLPAYECGHDNCHDEEGRAPERHV